jgi:arsenite-transporting ATPase
MKFLYFIGKGGVGKTTCALSTAIQLHGRGKRVYLVSLDPAHNIGDLLGIEVGDRGRELAENFILREVDLDKAVGKYLDRSRRLLRELSPHLEVFNLEESLNLMKSAPGTEEGALIEVFKEIIREKFDILILDLPPTGLALRFLSLPEINLLWIEKLFALRERIVSLRKSLKRIKGEEEEGDVILSELKKLRGELSEIKEFLKGGRGVLITEPERLSFKEALNIYNFLKSYLKPPSLLIINKVKEEMEPGEGNVIEEMEEKFSEIPVGKIPYKTGGIKGYDDLKNFLPFNIGELVG